MKIFEYEQGTFLQIWRGNINEAQPHINHHFSAVDPVDNASPDERYHPCRGRDARGRGINPYWGARPGPLAVRNAAAQRTAGWAPPHSRPGAPFHGYSFR